MYRILNNSKNGMIASQNKLDIIGQNMVNLDTNGYKKLDMNFSDLVPETLNRWSIPTNKDMQYGTGVRSTNAIRIFTQGSLKNTNRSMDLAIDGNGMFSVTTPDGAKVYTRCGTFNVDSSGKIVDLNGNILDINFQGGKTYANAGITADNIEIRGAGDVVVDGQLLGKIGVYDTDGENDFLSVGEGLYALKEGGKINSATAFTVKQGYIEASNVDMLTEMTDMMAMQKSLQFNTKGMQMANEMWGMVNNLQSK